MNDVWLFSCCAFGQRVSCKSRSIYLLNPEELRAYVVYVFICDGTGDGVVFFR